MKRKIFFCFLALVAAGFLISCASIPKEMVGENENLTVDVEISLHDDLLFTDAGFFKVNVAIPSSLRTDLTAQQIINVFQKEFFEALKERNISIVPGAPIKLQIGIAQGLHHVGVVSRIRYFAANVRFIKENELVSNGRMIAVQRIELYSIATTDNKRMAEGLAKASANEVVMQMRGMK